MTRADYAIFLNGSYGVGKSSALDRIGDMLAVARRPFVLMDVDWFHRSWPPAVDDPNNVLIEAANMKAVCANYQRAATRQVVVAGVIADSSDRQRYQDCLGLDVRSVRLEASAEMTASRLRSRYSHDRAAALAWHLERSGELAGRLRAAHLDECVIETDHLTPRAVAVRVLKYFDS